MNRIALMLQILLLLIPVGSVWANQTLLASRVEQPPVLDGSDRDSAWQSAKPIMVRDTAAEQFIILRSVHTAEKVYFLVQFPDSVENLFHKPWLWNPQSNSYEEGAHREDTFVFKWNMQEKPVNLSNFSEDDYTADLWYWKANRTNPAGFADDKIQTLGGQPTAKATETASAGGKKRYLVRRADAGQKAFRELRPQDYTTQLVNRYLPQQPTGSRADIAAKGLWKGGFWFIELARDLRTGHADDIQFDSAGDRDYLFGVSIFSLYGNPLEKSQPNLYGMGRISEPLLLHFQQ